MLGSCMQAQVQALPPLQPLVLVLKTALQLNDLGNAGEGSLSSYSLLTMVRTCLPPFCALSLLPMTHASFILYTSRGRHFANVHPHSTCCRLDEYTSVSVFISLYDCTFRLAAQRHPCKLWVRWQTGVRWLHSFATLSMACS